jgi:hypothetical protein
MVLVVMPMLADYSNSCGCARSLGTAAKIKIIEKPSLLFTDLWFGTAVFVGHLKKVHH